ncbi:hypothetical protein AAHN97_17600 [Chitinophaga niabensis]|uniref:hypothetical protein n=1 Tax=Chitinophaga niabensis TaxID=536979 RepID=UPI0031BB0721
MKMRDYLQQKKSENYQDAEVKGLLKAGAVASLLSKKFNTKISAKELIPFAREWHHAGIFKVGERLKGKRVYFFHTDDVDKVPLEKILQNRAPVVKEIVQGWYPQFFKMTDPATRRTSSKPFLGIYKGPANKAPKGFKSLNEEQFASAEKQRGRALKPFEDCKF